MWLVEGVRFLPSNSSSELALPAGCQLNAKFGKDMLCPYCHDFTGVTIHEQRMITLPGDMDQGKCDIR